MTSGDWTVHRGGMWLSRRRTFRAGDPGWDEYIAFIGLPELREVCTLDGALNEDLDGSVYVSALDELGALLNHFEPPEPGAEYYQLLVHQTLERPVLQDPSRFRLLGYDLSDETHVSAEVELTQERRRELTYP